MQYVEYLQSASRHLDVCNMMFKTLSSMDSKEHLKAKRQSLKLDIYYLSGYIIETMISYSFFVSLGWQKNNHIETCPLYDKGFKTHKLTAKMTFATSKAHCDYSGITLLGVKIRNDVERKMFNEWNEVVRYQNPKTYSKLEFTESDLHIYISDINLMYNQLKRKYFV